tara:strand:+ start:33903 stop:34160 length:258 start_codon:yes stop_codon:yes gene_type:complete
MPIYEYKCSTCSHSDDLFLKLTEATTKNCPVCSGKETFEKKVSAPAFKLNGSGWYETDFKKSKTTSETKSTSSEGPVKTENQKNV